MSLATFMNHQVTHTPRTGYDSYAQATDGTPVTKLCRFQNKTASRMQANGQVVTIDAVAYFVGDPLIAINDKITFSGVNYRVHGINTSSNRQGESYVTKLELQKWNS